MDVHGRQRRLFLIAAVVAALGFVILAALVQARAGGGLDGRVLTWFEAHRHEPLTTIAIVFDKLGRWWIVAVAVAILTGGLWWSGRMIQAVYLGATIVTSLALNLILKIAFQRQPPGMDPVVRASLYAFPSGHTMTGTAVASALAVIAWPTRWRWPALAVAALFALSMAVSRVYLGVHWPSDVAAGLALGFAVALGVRLLMPWPTPQEAAAAQAGTSEATTGTTTTTRPTPTEPSRTTPSATPGQTIDVVFLDWGNTLMVDNGMREGPMKDWPSVEVEPGAQEALRRLRARYRLLVATNAADSPALHVRLALARVGLDGLVDDVISSADVGDHKPHYPFYRAALLRVGTAGMPLRPSRAVMVGDGTTNDIAGAQRAGLRTIWYNPTKRRFPQDATPPDATIRKLTELPDAVDRLAGVTPERRSRRQRKADAAAATATEAAAIQGHEATAALRAETAAAHAAASAPAETPSDDTAPNLSAACAPDLPTDSTTPGGS